jgi:PAS domain S-box-containing protein
MKQACTHAILCLAILAPICVRTFALDPTLDVSQYAHTAWKIRDGFAKGEIVFIAQTSDGYLWLGTELELLRFDGVRAVPWRPPSGQHLPSNVIRGLIAARDGTLWIGTMKGLASWKDGKFRQYPEVAEIPVGSFLEDHEGTVWFGTFEASGARLCAIRSGKVGCYGAGTFGIFVNPLYEDHKGNLWVGSITGLWRWAPGPPEPYPLPRGVAQVTAAVEHESGDLLLSTNDGLKRLVAGKIESYPLPGVTGQFTPRKFLRSRDGSLWIGTSQGLLHLHQGRADRFSPFDGLSGDAVYEIFEDREGNVWVATPEGIDRFREYTIASISRTQGLSDSASWSVQASPDRSIWIGTVGALNRWGNGRTTIYRSRGVLGQGRGGDQTKLNVSGTATEIANSGLVGSPRSLGLDDAGRLWVSTRDGVFYFERGRFVRVPGAPGGNVFSIAGDGHGNVWILQSEHLFHASPNATVQDVTWSQFGQRTGRAMLPDREMGGVWLGFFEGGLVYLKDGKIVRSFDKGEGLDGRVTHLRFGPNGGLWASTETGLSRVNKDGHIETLTGKNGLPCDEVHWSVEDDDHAAWLYMPCGLVRIARSELDAWISDPKHVVKTTIFDNSDGVMSVGVYGAIGPHVTKSTDGRIWFVPNDGVSVIDPRHLPFNKLPPPVHIEQIIGDLRTYDASPDGNGQMQLPPRLRDLQIDYTALSLVAPEKVLFRYKLEGYDRDWQDVGTRRQAFYANLPPRNYRFRVMACNNSGVWNEAGTSLNFYIAPAYYQTWWFRSLCVLGFLAMAYGAYRVRVGQLRAQEEGFRETIESIPAMAFVSLPDGYRTFVNKGWVEYTGMTVEQSLGAGWHAVIHPGDLKRVLGEWEAALASGKPMYYEARYRRAEDGQYRWFMVRVVPQRNKRGKIVKWFGTLTDVEDRKRAEESLRSSEAYLVEAQSLTQTGSCAIDGTSHETVYWSDEMFRLFDFDPQQDPPMFDQWLERIHPEDREKVRLANERTFLNKVNCDVEFRIVKSDGTVKHIHGIGHPVLSPTGELVQVLGTMVDVTERKRAEEERDRLRQLEADLAHINRVSTLGEMAASLAHEIKQPIAAAITSANSCVEWLAHEPPNLDRARGAAARIDKYGNRAAEIIDRIRSFYRKSPPQRELVDVNGIIQEILALLKCEADRYSVAMHAELSAELPKIMADRVQLQQVFMNLMLNAIEAMRDAGGDLTVKSQADVDGQLLFSVCDTGVGLPTEKMDKIFSAFFTTKPQGSGMGLAISRSIVESHGGRLWASANHGRGATFHFTLPLAAKAVQVPGTGTIATSSPT